MLIGSCALQVATVHRDVLTLRWAHAQVAHRRVKLPPLPEGVTFSRLHWAPDDAHLLLLPESSGATRGLLDSALVAVAVFDVKQDVLTTFEVSRCQHV